MPLLMEEARIADEAKLLEESLAVSGT